MAYKQAAKIVTSECWQNAANR